MTQHPGWEVLVDYLEIKMRGDKIALLNGLAASHEDYLARTGRLVGMTLAIDVPREVAKLVENERGRRAERE